MIRTPLLWLLVCILFASLVIQLVQWQNARDTQSKLARLETTDIRAEYQKWRQLVSDADERRRQLEMQLLYKAPDQLLPELAKVADRLPLALVGVDELPERHRGDYRSYTLQVILSGDYGGFSELLAVVERIVPRPRIDGLRLYQRKWQTEGLWMSLTLSLMNKVNASAGTLIEMPVDLNPNPAGSIGKFSIKRDPFRLDKVIAAPAPQPNSDQNRSKTAPLLQLTGILWDDEHPIAIFSNSGKRQSVGVGETVAGTTIISIEPQQVIVKRGKAQHTLKLWKKVKGIEVK